jgi:multiple sugar transport system substrate-binding protein
LHLDGRARPCYADADGNSTYAKKYDITKIDAYTQSFYTTQDPFAVGQLAMIIDGVWRPTLMKLYGPKVRYGVSYQPYPRHGGHEALYLVGEAIAIPRGAKNADRAWEFIKWLSAGSGITQWCAGNGYLPAYKPALANPIFAKTDVQKTILSIMNAYSLPIPPCPAANVYWDALVSAVDKATHFKMTPSQALAEAQQTTQQSVNQFLSHYHA